MIQSDYFWSITFFLTLGTIAIRGSIIFISSKIKITDRMKEIFTFIPAAILPAMITPMVFFHQGVVSWLGGKERFFVLVAATLVSYYTKSMLLTLTFGFISLYLLKF